MKRSLYSMIVVIRVILISLNCFAFIWLLINANRPATTLFVFIILVVQVISLIAYHNRILRDLSNFLIFLEDNDTTLAFSKRRIERSFKGLAYQLDKINQKLQSARLERERQFHYLQAVVKQIDTGIIAFDQNGKVEILNQAARDLLGIRNLPKIDTLIGIHPEFAGLIAEGKKSFNSPVKIRTNESEHTLAVKLGSLRFDNRLIHLLSLQNIKPELEAGEIDAWRKLIRIQRHEIINSITPVTTLTTAIKRIFNKGKKRKTLNEITPDQIDDALNSVDVIEERSKGLIGFMERFKSLTDIPTIRAGTVSLKHVFDHVKILFSKELNSGGIRLVTEIVPDDMTVNADEKLLGQVLINLVKNSLESVQIKGGKVQVKAFTNMQNNPVIQVIDNGAGIEINALESIFVPSYTTKENGSGIGLSISRQIIQMHKGTIEVRSVPQVETVFEIILPE